MLELVGLSKHFGALKVIDGLGFTIEAGDVLGIIGPNGAGKTTLFNVIAGVVAPSAGTVRFEGRDIGRMAAWTRCRLGIGRTYQIPRPFRHMSVFDNVVCAATHGGGMTLRKAREKAGEVLEFTGLGHRAALPADALTLLDLKRLELARALGSGPRLLLLDEIAGGLTDAECETLIGILRVVRAQGTTIVWIEHVIHALRRAATRLAVLHGGTFIATGTPDAVLADSRVRQVYLGVGE